MNYKKFEYYFNEIKNKRKKENEFLDAMQKYIGSVDSFLNHYSSTYMLITLLEDAIDDECHWLSYYFYESDEKPFTCEIDGKVCYVDGSALSLWSLIKD